MINVRDVISAEWFWARVQKTDTCWLWARATAGKGYGHIGRSVDGRRIDFLAHRVAYELAVGPIPPGYQVLHSCDNPPCVRPDHLRAGLPVENTADMYQRGRNRLRPMAQVNLEKTHCPRGHAYIGANLYQSSDGHRGCRACGRERDRIRRAVQKALKQPAWRCGHPKETDNEGARCVICNRIKAREWRAKRKVAR